MKNEKEIYKSMKSIQFSMKLWQRPFYWDTQLPDVIREIEFRLKLNLSIPMGLPKTGPHKGTWTTTHSNLSGPNLTSTSGGSVSLKATSLNSDGYALWGFDRYPTIENITLFTNPDVTVDSINLPYNGWRWDEFTLRPATYL